MLGIPSENAIIQTLSKRVRELMDRDNTLALKTVRQAQPILRFISISNT